MSGYPLFLDIETGGLSAVKHGIYCVCVALGNEDPYQLAPSKAVAERSALIVSANADLDRVRELKKRAIAMAEAPLGDEDRKARAEKIAEIKSEARAIGLIKDLTAKIKDLTSDLLIAGEGAERDQIEAFRNLLNENPRAELISYNGRTFDQPYLCRRALKYDIKMPRTRLWPDKPWDPVGVDLFKIWQGPNNREKGTLDEMCEFFDIERPAGLNPISGSAVPTAFKNGQIDLIVAHCLDDVRVLREIYKRFDFGGWL